MTIRIALILIGVFVFSGCSVLSKKTTGKVFDILASNPATAARAAEFKRYYDLAEKFKKFHDSGELSDADVQDVLREAGVVKSPIKTGGVKVPRKSSHSGSTMPEAKAPTQQYSGPYRWPLDAGIVSSEYGGRWGKKHEGIDIAADMGVPLKSSANGVVIYSGSTMRGYGNAVIVRHDENVTTLYAHSKALLVRKGDNVTQGQTIALLGSSGKSTGPHVHYEIREGSTPLDPRTKLAKSSF